MHPLIDSKRAEIETLCRIYHVRELWLFGSATRNDFDTTRSDVDFLVEFLDIERKGFDDVFWKLLFALEDLFKSKVDLIELRAIRNPYFADEVNKTRVPLYAA